MGSPTPENVSVVPATPPRRGRDVDTVPYVELHNDRVQGVVSASSDVNRVYCAFLEASGAHYSSTNNNRPDAGMPKRLGWLVEEAVKQFGVERVARCLGVEGDLSKLSASSLTWPVMRRGGRKQEPAGVVFSRFLNYLRFVDLPAVAGPVPELSWFVAR